MVVAGAVIAQANDIKDPEDSTKTVADMIVRDGAGELFGFNDRLVELFKTGKVPKNLVTSNKGYYEGLRHVVAYKKGSSNPSKRSEAMVLWFYLMRKIGAKPNTISNWQQLVSQTWQRVTTLLEDLREKVEPTDDNSYEFFTEPEWRAQNARTKKDLGLPSRDQLNELMSVNPMQAHLMMGKFALFVQFFNYAISVIFELHY
jgi:hypothetical protein